MKSANIIALAVALGLLLPATAMADQSGSGTVSLASGQVETFDSLSSATTASDVLPQGWYISETGDGAAADGQYTGNDGGSNGGNVYSYGDNGSSERALGSLTSGKVKPIIGALLFNDTGATLADLAVAYTGEQWRRGNSTAADKLQFQYSVNATSLTDGTWADVPALDFTSPDTSAPNDSKRDGNASENRTEISGIIPGLNLADNAMVWVRWFDVDVGGNDDGLAIDDVVFGTPVDNPPELVASIPADGATDFPSTGSLSFTFSEPVAVSGDWFVLECLPSGDTYTPANSNVTGGPITFFVIPSNDLPVGDECTLDFDTTLITDLDGDIDNLIDPGTITFTVASPPPNDPPTLISTVPGEGDNNFPAAGDLRAVFSEPVTATAGAFSLACDATTGISLSQSSSDGGVTWIIATGTALIEGDSCTFIIDRNFIADLDSALLDLGATIHFTVLEPGDLGAYYQNVNTSSPEQLRCSLHMTIRGHTTYPYSGSGDNTWTILEEVQTDPSNSGKIIDTYRNHSYTKGSDRAGSGGSNKYNREHTWPRSLGLGLTSTQGPATDTHMLHLTDEDQNSARGNRPLGNCTPSTSCNELATDANNGVGGGSGVYPGNSNWVKGSDGNTGIFEAWNHRKGDIARAVMYMAIRYEGGSYPNMANYEPDLELTDNPNLIVTGSGTGSTFYMGLLSDIIAWHQFDPPTEEERVRNDIVQSYQGNRNPFVDHPEWGTKALFQSSSPATCILAVPTAIFADDFED